MKKLIKKTRCVCLWWSWLMRLVLCSHLCSNLQLRSHRLHSTAMERKRLPDQPASKDQPGILWYVWKWNLASIFFFLMWQGITELVLEFSVVAKRGTVRWWHFRNVVGNKILSNRPLDLCPFCFNLAKVGRIQAFWNFSFQKDFFFKDYRIFLNILGKFYWFDYQIWYILL